MPAVTTHLHQNQTLDLEATARHIEVLIDSEVSGLVMLGSLGENAALEPDEKRHVMRTAIEATRGRVPVLLAMVCKADPRETVTHFRAVPHACGLPILCFRSGVRKGAASRPCRRRRGTSSARPETAAADAGGQGVQRHPATPPPADGCLRDLSQSPRRHHADGDTLRFGGTMEVIWRGLRPCSPDGLPYVGRFGRYPSLSAATGHAMMGVSLAPITGRLMSQILSDEPTEIAIPLLNPDRCA